jgi:predicted GNAT superfamily acetyltransferase
MSLPDSPFEIRELESLADYDACVRLQDETWGHGFSERVPGAILRVAQKIGGVAAGAFDPDGELRGFVFGMTGLRDGTLVHWSDMLAVRPDTRGSGLAEQLKQYQRDVVRALGVSVMYWTADPLVARNAHFNINHLGARPSEYVENMYGGNTGSVLHGSMPTDRFVYRWQLDAPAAVQSGTAEPMDADIVAAIAVSPDGTPIAVDTAVAANVRVHLPHDLTEIQNSSTTRALAWRLAVRAALATRLGHGYEVSRFVRGDRNTLPYYLLSAVR